MSPLPSPGSNLIRSLGAAGATAWHIPAASCHPHGVTPQLGGHAGSCGLERLGGRVCTLRTGPPLHEAPRSPPAAVRPSRGCQVVARARSSAESPSRHVCRSAQCHQLRPPATPARIFSEKAELSQPTSAKQTLRRRPIRVRDLRPSLRRQLLHVKPQRPPTERDSLQVYRRRKESISWDLRTRRAWGCLQFEVETVRACVEVAGPSATTGSRCSPVRPRTRVRAALVSTDLRAQKGITLEC